MSRPDGGSLRQLAAEAHRRMMWTACDHARRGFAAHCRECSIDAIETLLRGARDAGLHGRTSLEARLAETSAQKDRLRRENEALRGEVVTRLLREAHVLGPNETLGDRREVGGPNIGQPSLSGEETDPVDGDPSAVQFAPAYPEPAECGLSLEIVRCDG